MSKLKKIVKSYLIFLLFLLLNALQLGREVSFLFIHYTTCFLALGADGCMGAERNHHEIHGKRR